MNYNKEKYENILKGLEKKYITYNVCVKFINTSRGDFDVDSSKKTIIKSKEMRYLLDILYLNTKSKIQYGSQFNLSLTYRHIWSYYDEILPQVYSALEAMSY